MDGRRRKQYPLPFFKKRGDNNNNNNNNNKTNDINAHLFSKQRAYYCSTGGFIRFVI